MITIAEVKIAYYVHIMWSLQEKKYEEAAWLFQEGTHFHC